MKLEYLTGLFKKPSDYPPLMVIGSPNNDTWYAGSYEIVKSDSFAETKAHIVDSVNMIKRRKTETKDWDWHHVVETQHISYIVNGSLHQVEQRDMPTILIHKPEHRYFSQNFNNNAFRELATISTGRNKRIIAPTDNVTSKNRINRIENLRMVYNHMYLHYPTLQKIANNVFNYHLQS